MSEQHPPRKPAHIREFTPRSILIGLVVALIIGASYPYVVLKFGFGPNISVVSAFFGFIVLGLASKSYNRWENNVVQTAGTTAGQIAFLCWLLAAFDIMAADPASGFDVHLTWQQTFVWLSASGLLGVFLAVPLRKHFIEDENLPFPDGMAKPARLAKLLVPAVVGLSCDLNAGNPQARTESQQLVVAGLRLSAARAQSSHHEHEPEHRGAAHGDPATPHASSPTSAQPVGHTLQSSPRATMQACRRRAQARSSRSHRPDSDRDSSPMRPVRCKVLLLPPLF